MSGVSPSHDSASTTIPKMLEQLSGLYGRETVLELIDIYIKSSQELITKIQSARERGDLPAVNSNAHSLKSSSANLGAERLSATCLRLEKSSSLTSEVSTLFDQLQDEWDKTLSTLKGWQESHRSAS